MIILQREKIDFGSQFWELGPCLVDLVNLRSCGEAGRRGGSVLERRHSADGLDAKRERGGGCVPGDLKFSR